MAEEYRRSLLGTTAPKLEYSNIEEGIRSSRQMQDRLSQLSQFAFRDLTSQAAREGQEYAVQNQVSLKQIADSLKKGEDVKKLFAEPGTVFGDSARVMQADLFRQDLTQSLTKRITEASIAIDNGMFEMDADQFANVIQAEIDGAYGVLADVDPQQALKFKATGVTLSNSVYEKVLKKQTADYITNLETNSDTLENSYKVILADNLRLTNGNFPQAVLRSMPAKQLVMDSYDVLPGVKGEARVQKLATIEQEVYTESAINIIATDPALLDDYNVYNGLLKNEPVEQLDFYRYLTPENKTKVLQGARKALKDRNELEKQLLDKQTKDDVLEVNALTLEYEDTKDAETLNKLIEISERNPNALKADDISKIKNNTYKVEPEREFTQDVDLIKEQIDNDEFASVDDLYKYARNKGYSDVEINKLFGGYFASKRIRAEQRALKEDALEVALNPSDKKSIATSERQVAEGLKKKRQEHMRVNPDEPFPQEQAREQVKQEILANNKRIALDKAVTKLTELFDLFQLTDFYNESFMNAGLNIDDPKIKTVLTRIKGMKPDAYAAIKKQMDKIQSLRIAMGDE